MPPGTCTCNTGYYWNATTWTCWVNCPEIANAASATSNISCQCNAGYLWNGTSMSCLEIPQINCSTIIFTDNTTAVSNACTCLSGFYWDARAFICQLDCSLFANVDRTASASTFDYCVCNSGYRWNVTIRSCILIPTVDCTSLANTDKTTAVNGACKCNLPYNWNVATKTCLL